ncbi:transposase [Streptomyces vinaceus]|nr:transposase [Streptomyces vinaceus]
MHPREQNPRTQPQRSPTPHSGTPSRAVGARPAPRRQGYDYDHLRKWLRERRIRHRIARKGIESSTRLGRHRWVVERTVSRLVGCRRLHRCYGAQDRALPGLRRHRRSPHQLSPTRRAVRQAQREPAGRVSRAR